MRARSQCGFSLIELMIAVAVVAIIAAVAYPAFTSGLQKSRRAEAIKGLLSMQLRQEEHRITNASYSSTTAQLGAPTSDYYDFAVSGASATGYTLTATAKGSQSGDTACATMSINKADTKTPADCWK
ncbi:type IV pilin protein [Aeromonas schubertii]|uniref:Type IV pilin protein n=1 Tax=Aeromonas schubertii TaxID=652 RepID=A0ABS7V5J7_9GAMM|nr:type IV pilin protein [Aeromonas schubertii]KUE80896.1 type IV pilin [Aeromonas schubertii]MBZ6064655.1 type IV pilin protein [Aeromonas schubertii]MBZ6073246.1 type IV pilin protein [Aeromonas schubertii]QCG46783.1 prepilin-type N-terminal cleavage/methylation domain-containing protein [Aeromonas schubertii]